MACRIGRKRFLTSVVKCLDDLRVREFSRLRRTTGVSWVRSQLRFEKLVKGL